MNRFDCNTLDAIKKEDVLNKFDSVKIINDCANTKKNLFFIKTYLQKKVGLATILKDSARKVVVLIEPIYEDIINKNGIYLLAKKDGKIGLLENFSNIKYPFIYDAYETEFGGKFNNDYLITIKNKLKGFLVYKSKNAPSECKYRKVVHEKILKITYNKGFQIFNCTINNNKVGYVGENGVEYFKD